jgi:iron complex transport system permease protein
VFHARAVPAVVAGMVLLLVASMIVAVGVGAVAVAPGTVWSVVVGRVSRRDEIVGVPRNVVQIVWELRVPRVVLAATVGAGLSTVGVAMQALVRNPLADPYVLGASSGASVGATLVILFGSFGLGSLGISAAAFVTGSAAMGVVYVIAQQGGRLTPMRLVLTGVVVGYVLSAITSFLVFWGDPRASQQVLFWLLGGFGRARWGLLWLPVAALALVVGRLTMLSRQLDALHAGDEAAVTLGVAVGRRRAELFVMTALMTAVMVAISGAVGFIGLVVPHITRLLVGGLHRRVVPVAALFGAVFMVWVDVLARTLMAPQEIPVGVLTAIIGGPLFLVLMRRRGRRERRLG